MELWKDENYLKSEFIENRKTAKEIAERLGVNDSKVEYYLGKYKLYGLRGRVKHTCNTNKFKLRNPIFNYYAGLIATDGYIDLVNSRVSLRIRNKGSKELLNNLKCYFNYSGEVREYNGNYDLTITSKELIAMLEELNVIGYKKTYKLQFPREFASDDCLRMFLRGVLDGDGNIKSKTSQRNGGQFRVVTASEDFIQGIINSVNTKFNLDYRVSIARIRGVDYPKLEMRIGDSMKFYEWIYEGYEDFRLLDKYSRYLQVRT